MALVPREKPCGSLAQRQGRAKSVITKGFDGTTRWLVACNYTYCDPVHVEAADDPLQLRHCISNNLQKTARAVSRLYAEEMRPAGLTRAQFPILGILDATGPLAMGDLAHRLYMERTTLTRHLKPLEDAGFVNRPVNERDARQRQVAITAAGRRKLRQAERYWQKAQAKMLERYGIDAWQQLEDALRTLRRLAV